MTPDPHTKGLTTPGIFHSAIRMLQSANPDLPIRILSDFYRLPPEPGSDLGPGGIDISIYGELRYFLSTAYAEAILESPIIIDQVWYEILKPVFDKMEADEYTAAD